MYRINFDEILAEKLDKMVKETPKDVEDILNSSLKKALNELTKHKKKKVEQEYTPNENIVRLGFKKKMLTGEGILLATKQKNKIQNFNISHKEPTSLPRGQFIKAEVKRGATKGFRTMFWGFYKNKTRDTALYIRVGSTREKIKLVTTVPVYSMAKNYLDDDGVLLVEKIFIKNIKKRLGGR